MKRLLFSIVMSVFVLTLASCYSTYDRKDSPYYGPVVDCEPDQRVDKVAKCVNNTYERWWNWKINTYLSEGLKWVVKKNLDQPEFVDVAFKEVGKFDSIKECYKEDGCFAPKIDWCKTGRCVKKTKSQDKYDVYATAQVDISRERERWGDQYANIHVGVYRGPERFKEGSGGYIDDPRGYFYSYRYPDSDIIILKEDGEVKFMVLNFEATEINDGKALITGYLTKICYNPKLTDFAKFGKFVSNYQPNGIPNFRGESCGGYRFRLVDDVNYAKGEVNLSLDKRIDPTKAYIKVNNKVLEVVFK